MPTNDSCVRSNRLLLGFLCFAFLFEVALTSCAVQPNIEEVSDAQSTEKISGEYMNEEATALVAKQFVLEDGHLDPERIEAYNAWIATQSTDMANCMNQFVHMREFLVSYESCEILLTDNSLE